MKYDIRIRENNKKKRANQNYSTGRKSISFTDKIEARYTKANTMLDKLPQSILAKAIRGELVAQGQMMNLQVFCWRELKRRRKN